MESRSLRHLAARSTQNYSRHGTPVSETSASETEVILHTGKALKQLIVFKEHKLRDIATQLHVSKRSLKSELKHRHVDVVLALELLECLNMSLDDFVDFIGYYRPGSAATPSAWSALAEKQM